MPGKARLGGHRGRGWGERADGECRGEPMRAFFLTERYGERGGQEGRKEWSGAASTAEKREMHGEEPRV